MPTQTREFKVREPCQACDGTGKRELPPGPGLGRPTRGSPFGTLLDLQWLPFTRVGVVSGSNLPVTRYPLVCRPSQVGFE